MKIPNMNFAGGMFGMEFSSVTHQKTPLFIKDASLFLYNGRSAIYHIVHSCKPDKVWLPNYLCTTISDAISKARIPAYYYAVDENLRITDET